MGKRGLATVVMPLLLSAASLTPSHAADKADAEYQVTPLRVQEMPAVTVYYQTVKTKLPDMSKDFTPVMEAFDKATKAGEVRPSGPVLFLYHNASFDKAFDLDVCFTAPPDAKAAGAFQVKTLPKFRCGSVVYVGPVRSVGKAYESLFKQINAAGMQATGQTREVYLFWDGPDSANNVTYVQAGIEE